MQCINANGGCLPQDLINSLLLRPQLEFMDNMLSIQIHSKSGSKWTISVYNHTGSTQTVFYNTKMCNNGDARNWTGLNNVVDISVNSGASKNVDVSENWFATSVTFSYINSGRRFVTFADELSLNPYTMNVKFNFI